MSDPKVNAESAGTVRVRIAVVVDAKERWEACGSSATSDGTVRRRATYGRPLPLSFCWVEADVPLPLAPQTIRAEVTSAEERDCPDGLLPDGPTCPRCGKNRAPSGVDGGTWVHFDREVSDGNA